MTPSQTVLAYMTERFRVYREVCIKRVDIADRLVKDYSDTDRARVMRTIIERIIQPGREASLAALIESFKACAADPALTDDALMVWRSVTHVAARRIVCHGCIPEADRLHLLEACRSKQRLLDEVASAIETMLEARPKA